MYRWLACFVRHDLYLSHLLHVQTACLCVFVWVYGGAQLVSVAVCSPCVLWLQAVVASIAAAVKAADRLRLQVNGQQRLLTTNGK